MVGLRQMFRPIFCILLAAEAVASTGAQAAGPLGTLPLGRYLCELPGDAAGLASKPVPRAWFDVINASSYDSERGDGTYLLTGDEVVFTRGPMRGARFERSGARTLKRTDLIGPQAKMRCVRTGPKR